MPIVTLLKDWSKIEPDRCSYVGDMFAIRGWTLTQETDVADRLVNAEIQCAVQEAIEAHGWHWVVGRIAIEKGIYYKGRISIQPDTLSSEAPEENVEAAATPRLNTYLSTHSPTHVLLQAYIDALKVMARVKPGDEEAIHGEIINKYLDTPANATSTTPEPASSEPDEDIAGPVATSQSMQNATTPDETAADSTLADEEAAPEAEDDAALALA